MSKNKVLSVLILCLLAIGALSGIAATSNPAPVNSPLFHTANGSPCGHIVLANAPAGSTADVVFHSPPHTVILNDVAGNGTYAIAAGVYDVIWDHHNGGSSKDYEVDNVTVTACPATATKTSLPTNTPLPTATKTQPVVKVPYHHCDNGFPGNGGCVTQDFDPGHAPTGWIEGPCPDIPECGVNPTDTLVPSATPLPTATNTQIVCGDNQTNVGGVCTDNTATPPGDTATPIPSDTPIVCGDNQTNVGGVCTDNTPTPEIVPSATPCGDACVTPGPTTEPTKRATDVPQPPYIPPAGAGGKSVNSGPSPLGIALGMIGSAVFLIIISVIAIVTKKRQPAGQ